MYAFNILTGKHCRGTRRRKIPSGAVVAEVEKMYKEVLVDFNDNGHSGQQFRVGGSEVGIGYNQYLQYPLLWGGSLRERVKIFVEFII